MPSQSHTGPRGARPRTGLLRSVVSALRTALRPGTPGLAERGAALPRLLRAVLRGDYRDVTRAHLGLVLLAALYVVSPVDLVPEAVLGLIGLADDTLMVTWLAATLVHDTEGFLEWERSRATGPGAGPGPRDAGGRPQDAPPTGDHRGETIPGQVVG